MTIPARIFQTWKSKNALPPNFQAWCASFDTQNPHYKHELWDDQDNRSLISQEFPWFLPTYDEYPAEIYRADAIRYFYLYRYGGIYADLDTECLRPLDELLMLSGVALGRMGTNHDFPHSIPNAIMASSPSQEFWVLVMALLMLFAERFRGARPEVLTGPILLKRALDMYLTAYSTSSMHFIATLKNASGVNRNSEKSRITLLDNKLWFPLEWSNPAHQQLRRDILDGKDIDKSTKALIFPNAWMVTYWAHTWE
jgi:mannosyltransferase OCH1-like enzyme